jgi:hypothetical protein
MRCHHRYVMRDQVRDQVRSIMGDPEPRSHAPALGSHFFATGVVAFFYALIVVLGR